MPTSSQAMIVITDEGDDPRVPRRHFPKDSTILPVNIGNSDYQSKKVLPSLKNVTNYAGFQNMVNAKGYNGIISYDATTNNLRWLVPTPEKSLSPIKSSEQEQTYTLNRPEHHLIQTPQQTSTAKKDEHEKRLTQLENIGVVKRRVVKVRVPQQHETNVAHSLTNLPKDAKYIPSPPGDKPRLLPLSSAQPHHYGDVHIVATNRLVQKEKPRSLLDELKEAVSYDRRVFPAMHIYETVVACTMSKHRVFQS